MVVDSLQLHRYRLHQFWRSTLAHLPRMVSASTFPSMEFETQAMN